MPALGPQKVKGRSPVSQVRGPIRVSNGRPVRQDSGKVLKVGGGKVKQRFVKGDSKGVRYPTVRGG